MTSAGLIWLGKLKTEQVSGYMAALRERILIQLHFKQQISHTVVCNPFIWLVNKQKLHLIMCKHRGYIYPYDNAHAFAQTCSLHILCPSNAHIYQPLSVFQSLADLLLRFVSSKLSCLLMANFQNIWKKPKMLFDIHNLRHDQQETEDCYWGHSWLLNPLSRHCTFPSLPLLWNPTVLVIHSRCVLRFVRMQKQRLSAALLLVTNSEKVIHIQYYASMRYIGTCECAFTLTHKPRVLWSA